MELIPKNKNKMKAKRGKYWMFTLFGDKPEKDILLEMPEAAGYLLYQKETAPETGRLHYQGYIEMKKSVRMTVVKKWETSAHLDYRNGTKVEAMHYVKKPHDGCECDHCVKARTGPDAPVGRKAGPWEHGVPSDEDPGRPKVSIEEELLLIKAGKRKHEVCETNPRVYNHYGRVIDHYISNLKQKKIDRRIIFCYGPPRYGKTHWVTYEAHAEDEVYRVPTPRGGKVWFDGYDRHKAVLFDEYAGQVQLNEWLTYIDVHPIRVEVKCGTILYNPEFVYVTSNKYPWDWYDRKTESAGGHEKDRTVWIRALCERIHEWHYWSKDGSDAAIPENPPPLFYNYVDFPRPKWIHHLPGNPAMWHTRPAEDVPLAEDEVVVLEEEIIKEQGDVWLDRLNSAEPLRNKLKKI